MSELINNREHKTTEYNNERLEKLKEIFDDLQSGKNIEEVKAKFAKEIGKVTVEEMSKLQHDFSQKNGMSLDDVKRIYSLHTEILKGSVEEIELPKNPEDEPGHPVHTFKLENRAIERLLEEMSKHLAHFAEIDSEENVYKLLEDCNLLLDIDKHYSRKENLIFPYLERYGIYGPSTNMWRIDDFIRDAIKETRKKLMEYNGDKSAVIHAINYCIKEVNDMIYREENILFPMCLMNFTEDEWVKIAHESDEIGFCLTEPGILSLKQLELMLNHLPIDITFIDKDDVVRYFSHGKERIFVRTKAVIGRTVQNCHPPRSVHVVEELLADFKSGKKDSEDFWIKFRDKYVYIRYFAVRDENGEYVGTLEFTQNIEPIQAITGEKRILS